MEKLRKINPQSTEKYGQSFGTRNLIRMMQLVGENLETFFKSLYG